jgi:hypothetical protein
MRNNQDIDKKNDSQYELNKATAAQVIFLLARSKI